MKGDAWSIALTGLSLTCVTGAALFILVAVNPSVRCSRRPLS